MNDKIKRPPSSACLRADGYAQAGQINATDRQIDQSVCELYGLTEEEVKIVEGNR